MLFVIKPADGNQATIGNGVMVALAAKSKEEVHALYDKAISLGYKVAQEGSIGGEKGRFAYLDTEHDQGTVIEISDVSGPKGQFFSYIRQVAADWDGTDPIRGSA